MEVQSIEIFGKMKFGADAESWLKLCKDQKKQWILKHTKQTDETLINEFINNPKISKDCKCIDCGKDKNKQDAKGDIASRVPEKNASIVESNNSASNGNGNSTKGQPKPKRVKGK